MCLQRSCVLGLGGLLGIPCSSPWYSETWIARLSHDLRDYAQQWRVKHNCITIYFNHSLNLNFSNYNSDWPTVHAERKIMTRDCGLVHQKLSHTRQQVDARKHLGRYTRYETAGHGSRCFTCWTRNQMCTAAAKASRRTPPWKVFPSVRRNQSQLEHGKLSQLELEFEFFCLVLANHASFPASSLDSEAKCGNERNRDISNFVDQSKLRMKFIFNRGKTGTGRMNSLQQQ